MKILTVDIETKPGERYYFDLNDQYPPVDMIISPPRLLCFAAKWLDSPKVHFHSEWDDGREAMVAEAAALMDEADAVVTYYGKRFDEPHLTSEFVLAGIPLPAPHKSIDLKDVARSKLKLPSNKLDYVAGWLGLGRKVEHEGFRLWRKIVDPETPDNVRRKAQRDMRRYNIGDTRLEEQVYLRVRPLITTHPNVGLYDGKEGVCGTCGGEDLAKDGYRYTQVGKFQRFRCTACGSRVHSGKRLDSVELRPA